MVFYKKRGVEDGITTRTSAENLRAQWGLFPLFQFLVKDIAYQMRGLTCADENEYTSIVSPTRLPRE